ncbi:hypothetical protein HCH_03361 [Hahella chejuensis KCTC 2396]|uniref:Uncharacterized protein n=1 Tax=Hahella chejuensis (strain KCTC 2396) TaxID=349521 RepID=Q2SGV9_HAHCH|nr:hypothetical protein HCH_03361 [Hahella chejuensis KCTC 2396]
MASTDYLSGYYSTLPVRPPADATESISVIGFAAARGWDKAIRSIMAVRILTPSI